MFQDTFSGYVGETIECERNGLRFVATLYHDGSDAPWERDDGHGPVSDWTTRDKAPGELELHSVSRSKLYYDFAEACRIARRDGWGAPMYREDVERGANGLARVKSQWFIGRELHSAVSDWTDSLNDAYSQNRIAMRATMTARQYAAAAAWDDFERLRRWCNDQWCYVGVAVVAYAGDVKLTGDFDAAIWGIESDAGDYLTDTAIELLDECEARAREVAAAIAPYAAA